MFRANDADLYNDQPDRKELNMRTAIFCIAFSLSLITGSALFAADVTDVKVGKAKITGVKAAASGPIKLNDKQISACIEVSATALIKKNKTTKTTDLLKNIGNKKCSITLTKPDKKRKSAHEVYAHARASVAIVVGVYKCGRCSRWHPAPASGFVISADGAIVTNYHVIENTKRETFVAYVNNKIYPVKEILAASKANDLAILQLDLPKGVKLKPLAIQPSAPVGSDAIVISHPDRRYFSLTRGVVSRYFHMDKKTAKNVPMMAITADYAKGSSGGPVLNDHGAVIGIVSSTVSVYYTTGKNGVKENLQMVFKQCVPAASLMKLIESKDESKSEK
jgi:S1-C subfamily serine protease